MLLIPPPGLKQNKNKTTQLARLIYLIARLPGPALALGLSFTVGPNGMGLTTSMSLSNASPSFCFTESSSFSKDHIKHYNSLQ